MVLSDPLSVVLVAVGTLIGTIFGAIPGLTATMAVTICLPMTFAMSDSRAIALLMALYIGGISGGLVSSILLNIPGTPASMVTAFDGAPMARKGEGAKALGTGIFFSFLGTIFGLIALIIIAPYLAAVAIKFGAFEYCALSIFSLSLVISLAGKDMVKGLAAALLGVMFSTFGISTFDSIVRYDFGSVNMQSGFQQLVVLIGLYAIPEVVGVAQKVVKPKVIMQQNTTVDKIHGLGFTWQEFKSQIGNFFIAAGIGTGIGILPGIGGGTAGIMSYTTIKNRSKTPEKFGTGIMDGVVASETANNAAIGGAMIPLLTLGIPGDGITAILLGSLIIHGIAPGPLIFEKSGALMYSIYLIIGLSSLFMMIFMLFANKASGITSMEDLLEKSKANPNSIKMGMSSGGNTHVYALLLQQAGFACNIVDGGDGSDRIAALVGGHVDVCFVPYLTAKEYVENGDVVPLCTIGDRCSALPDTPSINENGYVENNFNNYYVWLAPKGTDAGIVSYLASLCEDVANNNEKYAADQQAINFNDPFIVTGQDAIDLLAELQDVANENVKVLG